MKQNNTDYQGIMPYTFSLRKQNLSLSMEKKVGGKLLDCLKKLTKKEMKQFVLYVNSPFFNKNDREKAFYASRVLRKISTSSATCTSTSLSSSIFLTACITVV